MSVKTIILCDECGAEHKAANGWFSAIEKSKGRWTWLPLHEAEFETQERFDLCGQKCATEAFQRLLSTGSVQTTKEVV